MKSVSFEVVIPCIYGYCLIYRFVCTNDLSIGKVAFSKYSLNKNGFLNEILSNISFEVPQQPNENLLKKISNEKISKIYTGFRYFFFEFKSINSNVKAKDPRIFFL